MGRPAARVGDMHTCPQWDGHHPHVGGPIAAGASNVLINGRPAARIGDMAICNGPPDSIAAGAGNVLIAGRPAARLGDRTAHGGVVVAGSGNVMIGGGGTPTANAPSAMAEILGDIASAAVFIVGNIGIGAEEIGTDGLATPLVPEEELAIDAGAKAAEEGVEALIDGDASSAIAKESPEITANELTGKTKDEIRQIAKEKGLVEKPGRPDKFLDPVTGKERIRIDPGHVDDSTGLPYDTPSAAEPHVHGYPPGGQKAGKIVDPATGDPHFPLRNP